MDAIRRCPQCASPVEPGDQSCSTCGYPIRRDPAGVREARTPVSDQATERVPIVRPGRGSDDPPPAEPVAPPRTPRRRRGGTVTLPTWSLGLLALALLAVGGWYFVSTRDAGQPEQQPSQAEATPSAAVTSAAPSEPEEITYEVQAGDTLSTIAEQFDTTTDAIAQANDIADPNLITLGQVLVIPPETETVTPQVSESPTG